MRVVDSNKKKLSRQNIVFGAVQQLKEYNQYPIATRLAMVAAESKMKTAEAKQFGNTLFLAHRGVGANSNKAAGHIFNMDVGTNFVDNIRQYLSFLQGKKVTHYTALLEDEYLPNFQSVQKAAKNIDTEIAIGQREDGSYAAYIKLGNNPISEGL